MLYPQISQALGVQIDLPNNLSYFKRNPDSLAFPTDFQGAI
jgi:hypothetical protein